MKGPRVRLRDYRALIARGRKLFSPCYLVYAMPYGRTVIKAAVKKRIGNAVARNLEKRHIREALRNTVLKSPQLVLVILTRPSPATFREKKALLSSCLKPLGPRYE